MNLRIALAGNPNCGKTTLFNALTGSNQFVGNWPGVTVEKKEGRLKKHDGVVITDLPGIYSLSPYTLEEVVARNYLIGERPDAILNIVDGTNLERNLYLTTQLTELGIPVVVAINMMDIVRKNGDKINIPELSRELGCKIVEISALKGNGVMEAAETAIDEAKNAKTVPMHTFSGPVEHAIAHIEEAAVHDMPVEQQRWYAIKIFERDDKVLEQLKLSESALNHIEQDIKAAEDERDRRMTIMTTTFIPCGAKLPFIAMIAGAIFSGAWWVAPGAYFMGMAAIIISGVMLKKTRPFSGEPAPFVMELPAYHMPTVGNVLRSMWERGWSFIKKAGTIILISTILVWFTTYFGFVDGTFRMLSDEQIDHSILAAIGSAIAWIFNPLGWGNWQAAVASITGLVAKENIVGTLGILYGGGEASVYQNIATAFTSVSGFSFLTFNLLCAPCFAAIGAIKREMNSAKWTAFAILYQCGFAYAISLMINQIGSAFTGNLNIIGLIVAILLVVGILYMLFKPYNESTRLNKRVKTVK